MRLNADLVIEKKIKLDPFLTCDVTILQIQVPKVKLADRITALQQIVSPFGKVSGNSESTKHPRYMG